MTLLSTELISHTLQPDGRGRVRLQNVGRVTPGKAIRQALSAEAGQPNLEATVMNDVMHHCMG